MAESASEQIPILSLGRTMPEADGMLAAPFDVLSARDVSVESIVAAHGPAIRGIMSRGSVPVPAELIDSLPKLEIIARLGVGYDAVDVAAAARRGVVVTNTPDILTEEVADMAVGLLLTTIREMPQAERYLKSGAWPNGPFRLTASLRDRSIGIVGMGKIGAAIARRLEPFGRPIAYHARHAAPGSPYRLYGGVVALAEAVDTLILIVPGGAATKGMIGAEVLSALGPNGVVINVARGSVVDEAALAKALAAGEIAGAGLDVFENEPHPSPELLALENVVLLPHVGSGTHHTRRQMMELGTSNLRAWFDGRGPLTPVPETPWPQG